MAENYFGLTDTGKVRSNNEDTFIAQPTANNRYILAGVIDGVGGYNGGEVAAAIAREQILQQLDGIGDDFIPAMIKAFRLASKSIYTRRQQEKELDSMACVATMAVVDIESNLVYYAHVGDTRLYLLRDESLIKITKDHSFVGFLEDSGRLTEQAAMEHPKRNEINKALGFDQLIDTDDEYIETGNSPFLPGDILLICSDGLTDMVDKKTIISTLTQSNSLEQKATQLINAANQNGGNDNITVVLVHNNKTSQRPGAVMPAAGVKKNTTYAESTPAATPVKPVQAKPVTTTAPVTPKGNRLNILLVVLCVAFMGLAVWLYLQWQGKVKEDEQAANPVAVNVQRNPQEIKLQQVLDNAKGDTLFLADTTFKQPVVISDTLHLRKDTLYIKGKLTLKRDSAYHGPALALAATGKLTGLDGLVFEDFDTAIFSYNSALLLKNVRFINCRQAIQKNYAYPNKQFISSYLSTAVYHADSVGQTPVKPHANR